MAELEVSVYCYWNGCIKYGREGVYYEGPAPKKIIVNPKIALNRLLDEMYVLTGVDVDKQRSKVKIFGRYPSVVGQSKFQYLLLPVVNNSSLETMLEVPSKHPSVKIVELYLEVKSEGVTGPAACSSKRQKTVKVERDSSTGNIGDAAVDADMTDNKESNPGVPKPCLSSLWLDDHDLRVGLCFKDADELKKAVDWCSIKGMQKCVVRETGTDECMFECIKWRCKWSLGAAKMENHGLFEIIKYTGPHTCRPVEPEKSDSEFEADEIERLVRRHPTLSFSELQNWWKANIGHELETSEVQAAKEEAIKRAFGDWDQSFEDLPKLMSAFQSSNGLLVDWKYDLFPNPKFASFCGVFWAFPQSIQGFQHCRPLILVDTKELKGKHQLKLMIASGVDAADYYFPLAFAVTKEVSSDTWRWFLTNIKEKVTQRYGDMEIHTESLFAECGGFESADHALTGSVMLLFDELRDWFENGSHFSRASLNFGDVYTEPVTDKLEEFRTARVTYIVMPLDNNAFKVAEPAQNDEWIVQLSDCTCTCGEFQSYKFPCLHALAVCKQLKINPLQYVDNCYTFERSYKTYAATFSPVPELAAWPEASGVPRLFPPVIPPPPPPPSKVSGKSQSKATPKTNNKKS
ncbi:hypothetical protein YC2023_106283 [Brassica napus]